MSIWNHPYTVERLNVMTKFPSIPHLHEYGDRGTVNMDALAVDPDEFFPAYATEKIDGTNVRVCVSMGRVFIGSRDNWVWAEGDSLSRPDMGIADHFLQPPFLDSFLADLRDYQNTIVYYGELYGGGIGSAWKNYCQTDKWRCFKVFQIVLGRNNLIAEKLTDSSLKLDQIAEMREDYKLRMPFLFDIIGDFNGIVDRMPSAFEGNRVPRLDLVQARDIPSTAAATVEFLRGLVPETLCALEDCEPGPAEGIVLEGANGQLAKMKFAAYERTAKQEGMGVNGG